MIFRYWVSFRLLTRQAVRSGGPAGKEQLTLCAPNIQAGNFLIPFFLTSARDEQLSTNNPHANTPMDIIGNRQQE